MGTCLSVQELGHSLLSTLKTKWSSYLERLDEEFIERSGTWGKPDVGVTL